MIAFEISLNGKRICVAGAEDLNSLMATVTASGKLGKATEPLLGEGSGRGAHFDVFGVNLHEGAGRFWKTQAPMAVGDVFQVKIVEIDDSDPPDMVVDVPPDKDTPDRGRKKGSEEIKPQEKPNDIGDWLR